MEIQSFRIHCLTSSQDPQLDERVRKKYKEVSLRLLVSPTWTKEELVQDLERRAENLDNAAGRAVWPTCAYLAQDAGTYRTMLSVLSARPDRLSEEV